MKTKQLLLFALLALPMALSCNKENTLSEQKDSLEGTMVLSLEFPDVPQTKAVSAYTAAQTYESQVNSVQILVFNSNGTLDKYVNAGSSTSGISISTVTGSKTVWAVVNGPTLSSIGNLSSLKSTTINLGSNNSITASTGFIMAGSNTCTVGASSTSCTITVSRFVSRVALQSVKNSLPSAYGAITVNAAWISNVVGNQNLEGSASASTWYNKFGRADETTQTSSHIIDGSTYKASCPDLTFKSIGSSVSVGSTHTPSTPYLFYCMPNSSTTAPTAFSTTFSAQRTVLVVKATISGTAYYYPIPLDDAAPARNAAYTVALTITGLGSTDPNVPVSKGSLTASISVAGWSSGTTYDETI